MNMTNVLGWKSAVAVQLLKGKGDKKECKNYRGISLRSTPGKVYRRVINNQESK
jgi:hypothetical protein